jgi:hypothetical protein
MAIIGSVVDTQTIVANTLTPFTVQFPESNLTIVAIFSNATMVQIPIDASRNAVLMNAGSGQLTYPARVSTVARRVTVAVNGFVLAYSAHTGSTSVVTAFYYGTALTDSVDFKQLSGVASIVTLSSGAGSGTLTFPAGNLTMTGFELAFGGAAASAALLASFATSPGKVFNAYVTSRLLTTSNGSNSSVLPVNLPVSQTVSFTLANGTGSDVVIVVAYYQ